MEIVVIVINHQIAFLFRVDEVFSSRNAEFSLMEETKSSKGESIGEKKNDKRDC